MCRSLQVHQTELTDQSASLLSDPPSGPGEPLQQDVYMADADVRHGKILWLTVRLRVPRNND